MHAITRILYLLKSYGMSKAKELGCLQGSESEHGDRQRQRSQLSNEPDKVNRCGGSPEKTLRSYTEQGQMVLLSKQRSTEYVRP